MEIWTHTQDSQSEEAPERTQEASEWNGTRGSFLGTYQNKALAITSTPLSSPRLHFADEFHPGLVSGWPITRDFYPHRTYTDPEPKGYPAPTTTSELARPTAPKLPSSELKPTKQSLSPSVSGTHPPRPEDQHNTTPKQAPVAITVCNFATRWSMSKRTIENLIRRGLPIAGAGKLRRIVITEGDEWMRQRHEDPIARRAKETASKHKTKRAT